MDILNINKNGILKRIDNSLVFKTNESEKIIKIPILTINTINIYNHIELSTDLLFFLNQNNITINFFQPYTGNFYGAFIHKDTKNNSKVLHKQLKELYENKDDKIILLYDTLIDNMIYILQYYQKNLNYGTKITKIIKSLKQYKINNTMKNNLQEYMLFESKIWITYYSSFDIILKNSKFNFEKRTKNPPENELNALISFVNMKLYKLIHNIMLTTQLDPKIGFLHELDGNRYSLVLDISEIFKPLFVNKFIFNLINNNVINKDKNFKNKILLNDEGLFLVNKEWNDYMKQTIYSKQLKKHISYKYLINIQCYKIIKFLFNINEEKLIFLKYKELFE